MTAGEVLVPRLGVNIDHVATIRNARGGAHPDPLRAARLASKAGADGITAHLREDRRHISDLDIQLLRRHITLPLNLEMAATSEMLDIALRHRPHGCCLVPEKRQELTTEGGLDVVGAGEPLVSFIKRLKQAEIRVSLFVDPAAHQIEAAGAIGAQVVELHTGQYCEWVNQGNDAAAGAELERLKQAAALAADLGLEVHAGHGLTFDSVAPVAVIPQIMELNIGHFLIGEAIFGGLDSAIKRMRHLIRQALTEDSGVQSA